jgi:prepilin-type N-terminal cleavage/methylation domain-containing protein
MIIFSGQIKNKGITMAELMVVVAIISILSVVGFRSFSSSYTDRRLRSAAIELATVLSSSRDIANKEIPAINAGSCRIIQTLTSSTGVITGTSQNNSGTPCINTVLPTANVKTASGLKNLSVDADQTFTFIYGGFSTSGVATEQTVRLSDSGTTTQYCVNLTLPSSIVRVGAAQGASACNYLGAG